MGRRKTQQDESGRRKVGWWKEESPNKITQQKDMLVHKKTDKKERKHCEKNRERVIKGKSELEKMIKTMEFRLRNAPEGSVRIRNYKGTIEYYYKKCDENNEKNGVDSFETNECNSVKWHYVKKKEFKVVKQMVQRDYDLRMIKQARKRVRSIEEFIKAYQSSDLSQLHKKVNPYRRKIIEEKIVTDEEYIENWMNVMYKGKYIDDNTAKIVTNKGERVRSKSEKIIADKLYSLGIPYRYEYPLQLDNRTTFYPDFTILKMPERKEIYLEHFGMMDDRNYVEKVMYKLSRYEEIGLIIGVNLFITYETSDMPINTRTLDRLIRNAFMES